MLVNFRKNRMTKIKEDACYSKNSLHYLGYINNKENSISALSEDTYFKSL